MLRFWRRGVEKNTWRAQLPAADGVSKPTPTYLPAREQPASDKGSSRQSCVWREGVWRKEVELKRGRKGDETPREGKRSGTRGVYRTARNKKSVYTNGLADETKETKWNKPATPSPLLIFLCKDYCGFLNISTSSRDSFLCFGKAQATQIKLWTVRNLESLLPRCDRMRVCPLLVFLCLLCAGRAQKFSALTVGSATEVPEYVPFICNL